MLEEHICDNHGEIPLNRAKECRDFHHRKLAVRKQDALRLRTPLMISELGACSNSEECFREVEASTDAADFFAASWSHWAFKGFRDHTTHAGQVEGLYDIDGRREDHKIKALSRTYIQTY